MVPLLSQAMGFPVTTQWIDRVMDPDPEVVVQLRASAAARPDGVRVLPMKDLEKHHRPKLEAAKKAKEATVAPARRILGEVRAEVRKVNEHVAFDEERIAQCADRTVFFLQRMRGLRAKQYEYTRGGRAVPVRWGADDVWGPHGRAITAGYAHDEGRYELPLPEEWARSGAGDRCIWSNLLRRVADGTFVPPPRITPLSPADARFFLDEAMRFRREVRKSVESYLTAKTCAPFFNNYYYAGNSSLIYTVGGKRALLQRRHADHAHSPRSWMSIATMRAGDAATGTAVATGDVPWGALKARLSLPDGFNIMGIAWFVRIQRYDRRPHPERRVL